MKFEIVDQSLVFMAHCIMCTVYSVMKTQFVCLVIPTIKTQTKAELKKIMKLNWAIEIQFKTAKFRNKFSLFF